MNRLDALDQELARWQAVAAATLANVYELYEHPAFRTLAGDGPGATPTPLAGETLARVGPAVGAVRGLLSSALELKGAVGRAGELRATMPRLFRAERIEEVEQLLRGP